MNRRAIHYAGRGQKSAVLVTALIKDIEKKIWALRQRFVINFTKQLVNLVNGVERFYSGT